MADSTNSKKKKEWMQFVEPIRDLKKIAEIRKLLQFKWNIRNQLLFGLWINSALRISDLLSIRIGDLFDEQGNVKKEFSLKEKKTGKTHTVTITPKVETILYEYRRTYPNIVKEPNNYVFFHRRDNVKGSKPIWRKMAWLMIRQRCKNVWLEGNYWWHTLRKTRWYQARKWGFSMEVIQEKLNHSNMQTTKRYLWITKEEVGDVCMKMDL